MNYQFRVLQLKSGKSRLLIDFEDGEYELLSTFLESDVIPFENWIKEKFHNVIAKKITFEELNGNVCHVKITSEYTEISDNLAKDGIGKSCIIETKQLVDLIDIWCEKNKEFQKTIQKFD